jgi:hypothetical protein
MRLAHMFINVSPASEVFVAYQTRTRPFVQVYEVLMSFHVKNCVNAFFYRREDKTSCELIVHRSFCTKNLSTELAEELLAFV